MEKVIKHTYLSDSARILQGMKRFQKGIEIIRGKWGIPSNGYPYEGRADANARLHWEGERENQTNDYSEFHNELIPLNKKVRSELRKMSTQFNLDYRWHLSLYFYIVGGDQLNPPIEGANIDVRLNDARLPKEQWIVKSIKIDIYQETTLGDIRKAWKKVQEWQSMMPAQLPQRVRTSANVDRYLKIREYEDQGFSHKKIAEIDSMNFEGDSKAVSQLKSEMEKRFSQGKFKKIRTLSAR